MSSSSVLVVWDFSDMPICTTACIACYGIADGAIGITVTGVIFALSEVRLRMYLHLLQPHQGAAGLSTRTDVISAELNDHGPGYIIAVNVLISTVGHAGTLPRTDVRSVWQTSRRHYCACSTSEFFG